MDDFERQCIELSIRSLLGPISRIDLCTRNNVTPMTMFLNIAEESVAKPIDLFWVDDGLPAHFTLTNEHSSPVVFHSRHLELCGGIRALYTTRGIGQIREDIAYSFCLRMLAEFLLISGHIDQSLQCLAKSRMGTDVLLQEPDLLSLEYLPVDECYMGIWFFGLGHEIGHCIKNDVRSVISSHERLSLQSIGSLVDTLIGMYTSNLDSQRVLSEIISECDRDPDSQCYASPKNVQLEATCDIFSAISIVRTVDQIFSKTQASPDIERVLQELILALHGLSLIEQCRILAGWSDDSSKELEVHNLTMSHIALNARRNLLRMVFLEIGRDTKFSSLFGDSFRLLEGLSETALNAVDSFVTDLSAPVYRGLYKARRFLSSDEFRDTEIFLSYIEEIASCPLKRIEAKNHVRKAKLLGRSSPELDLLNDALR